MNSSCLNYDCERDGERAKRKSELFLTQSLFSSLQESMTKIKACLVDNKKHIRFGDWNGNDVSMYLCLSYFFDGESSLCRIVQIYYERVWLHNVF